jgi:hypothetical protein
LEETSSVILLSLEQMPIRLHSLYINYRLSNGVAYIVKLDDTTTEL